MPLFLLIRHAVSSGNTGRRLMGRTAGIHLTEKGREQAESLARRLETLPVKAIYSSPLERCVETVEPFARARGLEVRTSEGLLEIDYGRWTGRSLPQLARTRMWRSVQNSPSTVRFPGGESMLEAQDRAVQELSRIAASHGRATVAVVSHGDVIRLLLAHFAGVHVDLFQRLVVDPASVSAVAAGEGFTRILRVNDTGTLADLAPPPRKRGRASNRKVAG